MKRVVVTGAFSFTGAAVARELLGRGHRVHTLTNRRPVVAGGAVTQAPLVFDVDTLARELAGADAFVNTFWIRLPYGGQTFQTAVARSKRLIEAAVRAGVGRFVHVSVTNARQAPHLGYYRGKVEVEDAVRASGLPYAIVRPSIVVGPGDVLTNNIAWFLRRFPVFPLPGDGSARVQPVTLTDVGRIVADAALGDASVELDAAGPEVFAFAEYVRLVRDACGARCAVAPMPPAVAVAGVRLVELFLRDAVLTRDELVGVAQELSISGEPARGVESVSAWIRGHGETLGRRYVNDVSRHFRGASRDPVLDPSDLQPAKRP